MGNLLMRIEDNQTYSRSEFVAAYPKLSTKLVDKTLATLSENENLLIFPSDFLDVDDLDHDSKIIETVNDSLKFQNVIGFIGYGDEQLEIRSRFSPGENNYFLHYMLQRVLNINIVDLDSTLSLREQLYQLSIYLFPKYLDAAMRKGIFRQYRRFEYNNANIKGNIDIARHIKLNTPFTGKVAYSTREFTQDNELMQLVRHTIEFIRLSTKNGRRILNSSELTKQNVSAVTLATPSYNRGNKRKVIIANKNTPVRHAYYTEYLALQKLCLMILTHRRHSFGENRKNIYGILFDVAWLWEEYLNTLLKDNFIHPRNKQSKEGISLFADRIRTVYPDFYNQDSGAVIDAKYKKLEYTAKGINREDLYQIISYSYILKSKKAGIVYPSTSETKYKKVGTLSGYGADIFKQSIHIPQQVDSYREFDLLIKKSEYKFKKEIESFSHGEIEKH